ncbi:glycerol kinase GlpK [Aurantimonas marianensis]|uniref:Glycerol kinase n=1 Tax=Aurantimonas marianensis TaxID=2920428 RepID=A0A9X2HAA7_9HYPH|nr:glycerol kinase GlpK [Aurantimonas marianensis]MCP3054707.1 glycerol kinase GlpK [Aurantimonas marianensis]
MSGYVLAIDQGTTSSRAIVFDDGFRIVGVGQEEFPQHFPRSGWVEHDPEDIWRSVVATVRTALADASLSASDIAAIGITNQRETALIWDRDTGKPIHNAIVWQDRRTADICRKLVEDGAEPEITAKTGLIVDPYFSGTKIAWMLDNVEGARAKAEAGKLAFGTVDSFLLWRLTGGRVHATDTTNACRTMLFDIEANAWDEELLKLLNIPRALLPEVKDCDNEFGVTEASLFGAAIPVCGIAGDQHAATLGQACFAPGMLKSTYGTGCFAVLNTGDTRVPSSNRLLTTIAYRLSGKTAFALEGSIFIAGAAVQWLRDGLGVVERAERSGPMAAAADEAQDVYMVPAFTGLGAPWWDAEARGAIYGLTRNTGPNEIARAALEAVCFQTADLLSAMKKDWTGASDTILRVDGGMVASDWTMQRLADLLDAPVDRPVVLETTALGAAWVAGQKAGVWPDMAGFSERWRLERRFEPRMDAVTRGRKLEGWADAVGRTLSR